jgi:hypothetical protein
MYIVPNYFLTCSGFRIRQLRATFLAEVIPISPDVFNESLTIRMD